MLLKTVDLKKTYSRGSEDSEIVHALDGVSIGVSQGEFVSIMGPSGSGKSTLLHLIGGLDRPSSGQVIINGQPIEKLSDDELSRFRRLKLGFIFQFFNLLPTLTAIENVSLPLLLDGRHQDEIFPRAQELLKMIGMGHRLHHRPEQLSGGEMQRVAVARALVTDPVVILADEPTGNLDSKTGATVLEILRDMVKEKKHTLVMVTHDQKAASYGTRLVSLRDGRLESDQLL
jgi:putative ABC transport system ATP-binding protein